MPSQGDKLYECQECSTKFTQDGGGGRSGNMCPECDKFGMKVSDDATQCPHCDEWIDLENWEAL